MFYHNASCHFGHADVSNSKIQEQANIKEDFFDEKNKDRFEEWNPKTTSPTFMLY